MSDKNDIVYLYTADMEYVRRESDSRMTLCFKTVKSLEDYKAKYKVIGCKNIYEIKDSLICVKQADKIKLISDKRITIKEPNYVFSNLKLNNIDFTDLDIQELQTISQMFSLSRINTLDFSTFNSNNIINMDGTFFSCKINKLDLSRLKMEGVKDMSDCFSGLVVKDLIFSKNTKIKPDTLSFAFSHRD